ncbi:hypothetical protein H6F98_00575 [Microcoleus sp. FACHB-SPT15]|jgi:hypothetical protein|uniref:hypothetical protein n=1 Tax=Microcoleus sp. FACHB-SPT15 TaxID=2692830 RepID=UPI001782D3BB|nr:hypothetical protein [Microcoleus sp. FACHB-SPT15]MBD1803972.1 hypothetical protein [Microcoleus sp. FACHB-SPT15]
MSDKVRVSRVFQVSNLPCAEDLSQLSPFHKSILGEILASIDVEVLKFGDREHSIPQTFNKLLAISTQQSAVSFGSNLL